MRTVQEQPWGTCMPHATSSCAHQLRRAATPCACRFAKVAHHIDLPESNISALLHALFHALIFAPANAFNHPLATIVLFLNVYRNLNRTTRRQMLFSAVHSASSVVALIFMRRFCYSPTQLLPLLHIAMTRTGAAFFHTRSSLPPSCLRRTVSTASLSFMHFSPLPLDLQLEGPQFPNSTMALSGA